MQDIYSVFLSRYGSFTNIQEKAIPVVESGSNCIIIASTGSGKTEAALLPIFKKLSNEKGSPIRAIYITPLRALNRDLLRRAEWLSRISGIKVEVRHGDTPISARERQAASPPDILITTPETFQNLFLSTRLRSALKNVKAVIVDEVHELYANKRGAQLSIALERLVEIAGEFQRVGISATVGDSEEVRRWLCSDREAKIVNVDKNKEMEIEIEMPEEPSKEYKGFSAQFSLNNAAVARIERISQLVSASKSTLIFANTRQIVESIGNKLIYFNGICPFGGIGVHHSSLDKNERIAIEEAFKEGKIKSIIATSSLELGIDIGSIDLVIQYGSPKQVTRLVQRIGRGGHRVNEISKGKIIVANAIDAIESLAIVLEAKEGKLERYKTVSKAYDVLINQLCALSLEYKEIPVSKAYSIISRAEPYRRLTFEEFLKIAKFASEEKLIKLIDSSIGQSTRTRQYFYSNISVIPEIPKYVVKDVVTNKIIGSLDESFVSSYLDEGTVFITKGMPWKVISVDNGIVQVEKSNELQAAIPDWEGEDIPVTKETAKRVFALIGEGITAHASLLDKNSFEALDKFVKEQRKYFGLYKGEGKLFIENSEDYSIIYMPLGRPANELIAKLFDYAISASSNRITTIATPYAVFVYFAYSPIKPALERFFKSGSLLQLLKGDAYLVNSDLFRYKIAQVAKLAGIVDKNATLTRSDVLRIINYYKDTPIYEEAKRDLLENYFDISTVSSFLEEVSKGAIEIVVNDGISVFGSELAKSQYAYAELLVETHSEEEIKELEGQVVGKEVELLCTYCGFVFSQKIKDKDSKLSCPRCNSPMLCMYSDKRAEILLKKKKGKELGEQGAKEYEAMLREASLMEAYGNRALIALSTYGIGLATAARILKMLRKTYREFFIDLLAAQKNFVRTKKFWKGE